MVFSEQKECVTSSYMFCTVESFIVNLFVPGIFENSWWYQVHIGFQPSSVPGYVIENNVFTHVTSVGTFIYGFIIQQNPMNVVNRYKVELRNVSAKSKYLHNSQCIMFLFRTEQ